VALKELLDNALDACETAPVAPEVEISVTHDYLACTVHLVVQDNGNGIPADTVARILNFTTRTSDKSMYRAPTRGLQGNALKTVIGMPHALGGEDPLVIEACGVRHSIRAKLDPAGSVDVKHDLATIPTAMGTRLALTLPAGGQILDGLTWARGFSLFNPHRSIRFRETVVGTASITPAGVLPCSARRRLMKYYPLELIGGTDVLFQ
jgi:DNA topoisomerase VI subunit B